jgi:hypothetical protein
MNQQACGQEWRAESDEAKGRNKRTWSIEELRERLGAPAPKTEEATEKKAPAERPRIVRREAVAHRNVYAPAA